AHPVLPIDGADGPRGHFEVRGQLRDGQFRRAQEQHNAVALGRGQLAGLQFFALMVQLMELTAEAQSFKPTICVQLPGVSKYLSLLAAIESAVSNLFAAVSVRVTVMAPPVTFQQWIELM